MAKADILEDTSFIIFITITSENFKCFKLKDKFLSDVGFKKNFIEVIKVIIF